MFMAILFTVPQTGSYSDVLHWWMGQERLMLYTMEYYSVTKKEWTIKAHKDVDES